MNHDGSPSPMYGVFWMVFQNSQTFPGFPGISKVPELLQIIPEGSGKLQTVFGWSGRSWVYQDATGGVWMSGGHVWAVPEHLVLGKCWLASPIGTSLVKLMAGPGLK